MYSYRSFLLLHTMEKGYFRGETPEKGMGFILCLGAMLLFAFMGMGIDVDQYLQARDKDLLIPLWYFYFIFFIDFLILLSVVLIFFYRKVGIYLFPIATAFHFFFHLYFLDTFLYSDVTSLFLFIGIGLLAFIPKWQFFK